MPESADLPGVWIGEDQALSRCAKPKLAIPPFQEVGKPIRDLGL